MNPKSIAVLGASPRPDTMGNTVIKNLLRVGYGGAIYPIHPSAESVLGLPCHRGVDSLPEPVDCVVIALSADKALEALKSAHAAGARSAVLYASGFAETGERGAALQAEIGSFCRDNQINLCGPNCLGIFSVAQGVALYSAAVPEGLEPGDIALISHSGSACIALSSLNRFKFSHLVSLGNGAVTDIPEYLDYLAQDPSTKVAALFVETLRDPAAFASAAAKMRKAGKPIVALKVGRSVSGAAASAAHTGAIASSDSALQAFFRRHGVVLVEDYDELVQTIALFSATRLMPEGVGLGVLNVSGGELAMTCDIAERCGLVLPDLCESTVAHLRTVLPPFGAPRNPLDATGVGVFDTKMYGDCLDALLNDPSIHIVAVSQDCPSSMGEDQAAIYEKLAKAVAERANHAHKPVVFFNNLSARIHPDVLAPLSQIPTLCGMGNALRAIKHLVDYAAFASTEAAPKTLSVERQEEWASRLVSGDPFTERESKLFLEDHGIAVTAEGLASSESDAVAHAEVVGYPVVLKIESADLPHKSEVGGVIINLSDADAVRAAYRQIQESVARKAPEARVTGVLVQKMIRGGVEAILGVVTHRPFPPGIVVGSGGVLVEILQDATFELAPVDLETAGELVNRTRLGSMLGGYRGSVVGDRDALARMLERLSDIAVAYANELEAIDLNPVAVLPEGSGAVVLDALVIAKTQR
ncbi:acetate--CoA ligase family protein [Variovorax sp. PBS-H4]|uniref:acetate--CoA ligase family protein n=1 Tax=Variovorax sp. PBS-H4 TaxID=434008 RepID=UPI001E3A065E|nr:acetate--CoA ligase family protein [Variovorax sp. PBS-H4]